MWDWITFITLLIWDPVSQAWVAVTLSVVFGVILYS